MVAQSVLIDTSPTHLETTLVNGVQLKRRRIKEYLTAFKIKKIILASSQKKQKKG